MRNFEPEILDYMVVKSSVVSTLAKLLSRARTIAYLKHGTPNGTTRKTKRRTKKKEEEYGQYKSVTAFLSTIVEQKRYLEKGKDITPEINRNMKKKMEELGYSDDDIEGILYHVNKKYGKFITLKLTSDRSRIRVELKEEEKVWNV